MTIDGRISPAPLGSSFDRALLHRMRAETDASLMGANTLRQENPRMALANGHIPDNRIRAIVSGSGTIPYNRHLFQSEPAPVIFSSEKGARNMPADLQKTVCILPQNHDNGRLSMTAAIIELARQGAGSVLLEGGGHLNSSCLEEGIVDEIMLTIVPKISGNSNASTFIAGRSAKENKLSSLVLLSCNREKATDEIFLHYRICSDS